MFDHLVSHYEHVFCISLSGALSGTWQAARSAAERARRPDSITIIDSQSASLGQGLIALHAAECVAAGMEPDDITASIERIRTRTRAFGMVVDLSHAVRGGRIHSAVYQLGRILRVNPVLHAPGDGSVGSCGFIFGGAGALTRFALDCWR